MAGGDADAEHDLERHGLRRRQLDVEPGQPAHVEQRGDLARDGVVARARGDEVERDLLRVPGARPAPARDGALHAGMLTGDGRIVGRRDRAQLLPERVRRELADGLQRLWRRAADRSAAGS